MGHYDYPGRHTATAKEITRSMITDYFKIDGNKAQETFTEQDTPQDKERMKITPTTLEILRKAMIRQATAGRMKAIPKAKEWGDQEGPIEDYDCDV